MSEREKTMSAVAERADGARPSLEADARALRATFRELGFERSSRRGMLSSWAATFVAMHALVAGSLFAPSLPVALILAAVSGAASLAIATRSHTASHHALTGSTRLDRFVLSATLTVSGCISSRYWLHSHLRLHHPAPNVVGFDDDCDLRPVFCINEADLENVRPSRRWLFRFQALWLALLLPLNLVNMQRQGLLYWWRERPKSGRSRRGWIADGIALVLFFVIRFAVPLLLHVSVGRLAAVWSVWAVTTGLFMFAAFAPGHYPHSARVLAASERGAASFWLRQTATTVNFRTGALGAFLCSGLEHQIEHHLFPGYCHVHYAKMAPLVRAFCERQGLPYTELGWGEALLASFRAFFAPKPIVNDVRALVAAPAERSPSV